MGKVILFMIRADQIYMLLDMSDSAKLQIYSKKKKIVQIHFHKIVNLTPMGFGLAEIS